MYIIKIRDSPFSLFTWYQSQKGKPNFFDDRVFFRSLYSSSRTLRHCRRISSPLPLSDLLTAGDFFRLALLWPKTLNSEAHEADLHVGGNPAGNRFPCAATHHSSPAACIPCAYACGRVAHFLVPRFHLRARPAQSC